jgi:hypothetical protein
MVDGEAACARVQEARAWAHLKRVRVRVSEVREGARARGRAAMMRRRLRGGEVWRERTGGGEAGAHAKQRDAMLGGAKLNSEARLHATKRLCVKHIREYSFLIRTAPHGALRVLTQTRIRSTKQKRDARQSAPNTHHITREQPSARCPKEDAKSPQREEPQ